ncbi:MAG: substrate-binding domain-containing protein [Bacilli bacterium]|nr:substrate-binding domain-containing protein [Bacilli bacterium]
MKRLAKQIISIALLTAFFVSINVTVYGVVIRRCINDGNDEMKAKSIEVSKFLPFDEDSQIVKVEGTKLTGKLPIVDGAAALFPLFSSYVHRLYPEDSVKYKDGEFEDGSSLIYTNTRGAYKGIVDGQCDIAFLAKPSSSQLDYAREKGVTLKFTPIGREAFVFLVNSKNPVDSLSVDQVKGIYSGRIKNWKEVGGDNRICCPLQRNEGSGSQTAMKSFMGDEKMVDTRLTGLFGQSIGFSFRYYVEGLSNSSGVKMISLDGIEPNKDNIRDGSYPVVNDIFMVTRENETNPNVESFVNYVLSPEGQDIEEKVGYVGVC